MTDTTPQSAGETPAAPPDPIDGWRIQCLRTLADLTAARAEIAQITEWNERLQDSVAALTQEDTAHLKAEIARLTEGLDAPDVYAVVPMPVRKVLTRLPGSLGVKRAAPRITFHDDDDEPEWTPEQRAEMQAEFDAFVADRAERQAKIDRCEAAEASLLALQQQMRDLRRHRRRT